MEHPSIKNGIIGGIIIVVLSLIFYIVNVKFYTEVSGYITFIIMIYFLYRTAIQTRNANNGFISQGLAFKKIFITFFIISIFSIVFTYILYNYIDSTLLDNVKDEMMSKMEQQMTDQGNEDKIEEVSGFMDKLVPFSSIGITIFYWFLYLIFGTIISLIIAAIMKKKDPSLNEYA